MFKFHKDARDKVWKRVEKKIQEVGFKKDKKFVLKGKWKKFIRIQNNYKIFSVDGNWIRKNLCVYYGHGGHGLVHEFIPLDEIWIDSHHYNEKKDSLFNCPCKTLKKCQKVSKNYFGSTAIHEITEIEEMKKGMPYWKAHQIALKKEKEIKLIKDPFNDIPKKTK